MTGPTEVWSRFTHDPRDPQHAPLRASDGDREVIHRVLADAYADGRLDREEFDARSEQTSRSRTLGELPVIVSDLVSTRVPAPGGSLAMATPEELRQRAVEAYASDRRGAVFSFLAASVICTVIWLVTTGIDGFPWPAFVAAATGVNVIKTVVRKPEIVAGHLRRLEKKQAKELRPPRSSGGWSG